MRFGRSLRKSIYEPWRPHYLDYQKLKVLLREEDAIDGDVDHPWTDEEEQRFTDELINVQLEKVNAFQVDTFNRLRDKTSELQQKLDRLSSSGNGAESQGEKNNEDRKEFLEGILKELDQISQEINELSKFSRINFTGALKAAKKHDRRRGTNYKVKPLVQVRLAALPFNSEDYSPLLYRLSSLYAYVRQGPRDDIERTQSTTEPKTEAKRYVSHKFFIHPENLLEVKTYVLRHLPVLVYTPKSVRIAEGSQKDPTRTSIYFDNPAFSLYTKKVEKGSGASSLRLLWYDQLAETPEIVLEKKTLCEGDDSEETQVSIKDKYIIPFLRGEYKLEKNIRKLQERNGEGSQEAADLRSRVAAIQDFVAANDIQPVLRANYTRMAFQIPGDDKIRVSIDTNLAFIREDTLDQDRSCRDPDQWHRTDIDDAKLEYPFSTIKKGEISKFPYAVLEIKVREGLKKRKTEWVEELMSSHLVREAPRFSKFVHGVASLFEDNINTFPFWMSLMDIDIRRDPEQAFQEEQEKKAKQAEDEVAVGSLLRSMPKTPFKPAFGSPVGKQSSPGPSSAMDGARRSSQAELKTSSNGAFTNANQGSGGEESNPKPTRLRELFPSFSTSKYARAQRSKIQLPPGVRKPGQWIKDSGPVQVEPKVWLANQRTFVKWQHITVLLATLALSLYNSAGASNPIARTFAIIYTIVAVFTGLWGWWIYIVRCRMIEQRSGKDFDNVLGPIVLCLALVVGLCLNFGLKCNMIEGRVDSIHAVHEASHALWLEL